MTHEIDQAKYITINGVKVEKKIIDYLYECDFTPGCSFQCCSLGAYVSKAEIIRIRKNLRQIKSYLSESKKLRLGKLKNKFVINQSESELWKTRVWDKTCIFLMTDGRCAIHAFCLDNDIDWIKFKFNICTTFPLDIKPGENCMEFMRDWQNEEFDVWCIRSEDEKKKKKIKPIIYTLKDVIVDRLGTDFWLALEKEHIKINKQSNDMGI